MISIIIPACNEEKYILETINSIHKQNYRQYEIIVICNGCTDNTFDVAKNKVDKIMNFPWRNIAKARNEGARIAKYDKLIFLDADTSLVGDVLKTIVENDFVIGTCKFKPDNNKLKHKLFYSVKSNLFSPLFKISNGIMFCDKKNFSGFDENLKKGEEGMLIRKTLEEKNAKFVVLNEYVKSSTRRYDQKGYFSVLWYWANEKFLKPSDEDYPLIR